MLLAQSLAFALTAASLVSALTIVSDKNDWSTACTDGSCRYYTGDGLTEAFSTISLTGPATALSDISPAAGWLIQGCDAKWSDGVMKVTLVCSGTPAQMANCASLFAGGAKDTIVRLPESCGTGPFARVVSSNDITPSSRIGAPETHELVLDYDFAAITEDRGEVEFEVTTSNLEETGLLPRGDVMKRWSANKMFNLPLINIDQSKNLFNSSVNCPASGGTGVGFSASISVDAHAKVNAQVAFGFTISGSIIPPKVKNAQVLGSINGSAVGDFVVAAQASGSFETGQVQIYSVGLPGLSIPGILTVGPSFGLKGRLYAEVGVAASVRAGVNWNFPGVEVAFPNNNEAGANAIQSSSPLIISLDPSVSAHGLVTASIIPRLDVGVKILMGLAEATLFVDLEARAELDLSLNAEGHYTTAVRKRALNPALNPDLIATPVSLIATPVLTSRPLTLTGIATDLPIISRPTDLTPIGDPVFTSRPITDLPSFTTRPGLTIPTGVITGLPTFVTSVPTTKATATQSWSANGCASLDLVLDINAGATGKLKPIFDKAVTWDLYTKEVNVFNKCFNVGSTAVPRKRAREFRKVVALQRREFQCPALGLGNLIELFRN